MNRLFGRTVACVALGAAMMYAAANLRVRVDLDSPEAVAQPARLPDGFASLPLPPVPSADSTIQQAKATRNATLMPAPEFSQVKVAKEKQFRKADDLSVSGLNVFRTNATKLESISITPPKDAKLLTLVHGGKRTTFETKGKIDSIEYKDVDLSVNGKHTLAAYATFTKDDQDVTGEVAQIEIRVRDKGPRVEGYSAFGFGAGKPVDQVVLQFSAGSQLDKSTVTAAENFVVSGVNNATPPRFTTADYDSQPDILTVHLAEVKPGSYQFALPRTGKIRDLFGNPLEPGENAPADSYFTTTLYTQLIEQLPLPTAGVPLQHGPYVPMREYEPRLQLPHGFNPSDRVETRVARLYYYRDAHRVAMIVNRSVKSYAAAAVDIRQRAAERSRDDADRHTIERKRLQAIAFRTAQEARAAENELKNAQARAAAGSAENAQASAQLAARERALAEAKAKLDADTTNDATIKMKHEALAAEVATLRNVAAASGAAAANANASLARLQLRVQNLHDDEVRATEAWQVKELEETRLRSNEFRLDVAAATADPITYAPGVPSSSDPVQQVSVSVIGEGLIQLRGPIKGVNIIRIMINQIDAPVGQVRVAVHTVQVNGERGNRMEKVVANIQRYVDHARFLTAQTSQMLKNAVTTVAARRAEMVAAELGPLCTQEARDRKYLHAFFGKDFIDELVLLDSEFLKTGNKLLSLHSMDSTSLSGALFLMALAKNEVRREIIAEFQAQLQGELPQAEFNYYLEGLTPEKCDACCDKKHYMLAQNAKFQSLIGFFNAELAGTDTISPLQREFIRLAQIFKANMVTEITMKQRVLERSLVEERIGGDVLAELLKAKKAEDAAKEDLQLVQIAIPEATRKVRLSVENLQSLLGDVGNDLRSVGAITRDLANIPTSRINEKHTTEISGKQIELPQWIMTFNDDKLYNVNWFVVFDKSPEVKNRLKAMLQSLSQFVYESGPVKSKFFRVKELVENATEGMPNQQVLSYSQVVELRDLVSELNELIREEIAQAGEELRDIVRHLNSERMVPSEVLVQYRRFKDTFSRKLWPTSNLAKAAQKGFAAADETLIPFEKLESALQKARLVRRPLDQKKLLDLLVDDIEDKYIEQLEGTRAHTANVDNYLKAITTALDDDFNTQFYFPAFRKVREASRLWDVTLGQIETTSVLTNNRAFAKVSPSATMEFDLPKRDIMITEGFKSAKALFDEYGALMNDPTFLALGKLYSGVPSTGQFNSGGGFSAVRNVLPGLPGSPDESIMAQEGPGRKEFGTALDALIPDPAVYKFETGTGYEIRPVLAPDGQAVVFNLQYLYTTDVREPVRADEKHLGRVKRHYVHTDVHLSNFELREVSRYMVALKAARTAKGVPLLQDVPGLGILFRPLPSAESSLQENIIYSQATIFPTLFDLMGLRYARSIADLDPLATRMAEFAARNRELDLMQRTAEIGASRVDDAMQIPYGERRRDLYYPPTTIPYQHPNGYMGPEPRLRDSSLIEGPLNPYDVRQAYPDTRFAPGQTSSSMTKPLPPDAFTQPQPLPAPNPYYPQTSVPSIVRPPVLTPQIPLHPMTPPSGVPYEIIPLPPPQKVPGGK